MYKLIEFTDEQGFNDQFVSLARVVYANDKNHASESKREVTSWLLGAHPGASFLHQRNLLVMQNGAPAARGIAFVNTRGDFGSVGFFECLNDSKAVGILMDGAREFCREHSVGKIYAPMNGSIWAKHRLMVKGFDDKPFLGEPYNRPYYSDLLLQNGFSVAKTWKTQLNKELHVRGRLSDHYQKLAKSQTDKGIFVRSIEDFDEDIRIIYRLVMSAFSGFFLFHTIDEQDFVDAFSGLRLICDKRTAKIAYNSKNEPIGFGIALPDYQSKLRYVMRYAKRYIFMYAGTLQENGRDVYPHCGKAVVVPIALDLISRKKEFVLALMSEDASTRNILTQYDKVHEHALLELEVD